MKRLLAFVLIAAIAAGVGVSRALGVSIVDLLNHDTVIISEAVHEKPFAALTEDEQKALLARFEHKVSDHLPLWLRLPLP